MVEATDVTVSFDATPVLEEVTLSIDRGSLVGLIGPNGAGKTTLLRTINGVLEPDHGQITVAGLSVTDAGPRSVSRRVATVSQDTILAFDFPVADVVGMGRTPYRGRLRTRDRVGPERVEAAMEATQTRRFADRPIGDLSGGERQRVVLARALAQDTPVLLLDEPTASLDINHQVRTLELVRSLVVDSGKTILAAIHDLNLAAHYCDRLVILHDGVVLAAGAPEAVLTEDRLQRAFDTDAAVSRHPVTGSVYVTALIDRPATTTGHRVHVIGGGGTASRLLYVLRAAGHEVSTGALNEGDTDLQTARNLGITAITVPPMSGIDTETERLVNARIRSADVTVVADVEVGPGNLPNLTAAKRASRCVLIEDRPFEERNYAGEEGRTAYRRLLEHAVVVDGVDGVFPALETVLERPPDRPGDSPRVEGG